MIVRIVVHRKVDSYVFSKACHWMVRQIADEILLLNSYSLMHLPRTLTSTHPHETSPAYDNLRTP